MVGPVKELKPRLMLTQSTQRAHLAFDAVEEPRAEPQHDEHKHDQQDHLHMQRQQGVGMQQETPHRVEAVGQRQY